MGYLLDNWHQRPGLDKHSSTMGTMAKEIFGIGDMQRGFNNLGQGNILKGVGQMGLGALVGATTLIPGVGWAARGGLMGAKALLGGTRVAKAVKGAKTFQSAKNLTKMKSLQGGNANAYKAGKAAGDGEGFLKSLRGKTKFHNYMREGGRYGASSGRSWYNPREIGRGAYEFMNVGLRGTQQGNAFRAGQGGIGAGIATRMGTGVAENTIRTGAGRLAARRPFGSSGAIISGGATALAEPVANTTQQWGGSGGFNLGPLAAGRYQPAAWEQSRGSSWLR